MANLIGVLIFPMFARDDLAARRSNGNELVFIRVSNVFCGKGTGSAEASENAMSENICRHRVSGRK